MEADMRVLLTSGLIKVLFTAAVLTAVFVAAMSSLNQSPGARSDGSFVVAQRFCPNGRC